MAAPFLKQSALFGLAVALPSCALVLLSWRMISQESELARNRSRERLEQGGLQVASALKRELARVADTSGKSGGADSPTASSVLPGGGAVMLALVRDERLVLPWEVGAGENASNFDVFVAEVDFVSNSGDRGRRGHFPRVGGQSAIQFSLQQLCTLPGKNEN